MCTGNSSACIPSTTQGTGKSKNWSARGESSQTVSRLETYSELYE